MRRRCSSAVAPCRVAACWRRTSRPRPRCRLPDAFTGGRGRGPSTPPWPLVTLSSREPGGGSCRRVVQEQKASQVHAVPAQLDDRGTLLPVSLVRGAGGQLYLVLSRDCLQVSDCRWSHGTGVPARPKGPPCPHGLGPPHPRRSGLLMSTMRLSLDWPGPPDLCQACPASQAAGRLPRWSASSWESRGPGSADYCPYC